MKTIFADGKTEFEALAGLAGRGGAPGADVEHDVQRIIDDVRTQGDEAVVRYTARFDGAEAASGGRIETLSRAELKAAFETLDTRLADALLHAAENIRTYHKKQIGALAGYEEKYPGADGETVVRRQAGAVAGYEEKYPGADGETVVRRQTEALAGYEEKYPGADGETVVRRQTGALAGYEEKYPGADGETVVIGQIVRGLTRVGVYVPGGTAAYPSTVLMNVIPAKLAGVEEIVMVTPPRRDGSAAAILGAAYIAGVDRVLLAGGAQAVAALAFGTETFPRVDKIVGPGNIYVATAKRLLFGVVDIDMIAGPSEILIVADGSANAAFAAADLLSQAEHDPAAASILLTTDPGVAAEVSALTSAQLMALSRASTAESSLARNGLIIVCRSEDEMVMLANEIAPEHLEILTSDPFAFLTRIKNAGSVFLGPWTPEPVGDYYSGTNHVLPTSGTARFASPLGVYDFVKRMSYTRYTEAALSKAGPDIIELAEAEGLTAHAEAVKIRFKD